MAKRASGRPSKVLPPGVVASQRELAQAINVSARTIESWRKSPFERGMPMREDGTYSIAEVLQWKARRDEDARARKEAGKAKPSDGVDPDDLDLVKRNLYFDAKLKEEKLKAFRAKAMPIPHVQQLLRDRAGALRKELMSLPRRLAPRCEGKRQAEIRDILEEAFTRALDGYAAEAGGTR
jgi:DNA-binding transcriptional MocR family regulator